LTPFGTYNFGFSYNHSNVVLAGNFALENKIPLSHIAGFQNTTSGGLAENEQVIMSIAISSMVIDNLNEFVSYVVNINVAEITNNYANARLFGGIDPRAITHLRSMGYLEQRFTHLGSLTQDGVSATLFQDITFFRHIPINMPSLFLSILAGTGAAVAASAMGVTIPFLVTLVRTVIGVGGQLIVAANSSIFYQYVSVVHEKFAVVNGLSRFEQATSTRYRILFGDIGTNHNFITSWQEPNFHNNTFIMQEAIRRYRNNIWSTN